MAQKQYEYFGNRNTVQGNPVLANRYARGQVYGQRLANDTTGQSAWSKDPWFQFGSAIGQAWGDNYNERGIANGKKDMNEFVNSYLGQYAENPTQAQQPQGPLNELDSRNISGNLNYNGPDDWKGELMNGLAKGTQLGELAKKMNAPSGNPLDPSNVGANLTYFTKDGDWNLQQPDLGGARLMYKYNKYKDSDNPDSEALQNKQDIKQLNQMGNNIDFGKVDKEDLRQKLEQHLLNDKGRTPVQTATILGEFDKIYDSKMSQWKQGKATDLVAKGRKALENGNYELAMTNFAAAGEYDSKIANPLMQVANNSWQRKMQTDQYNMSKQIELAKNGLMLDENGKVVRDPSSPIWNQAKYGGTGGRRGGSGGGSGGGVAGTSGELMLGGRMAVSKEDTELANKILNAEEGVYLPESVQWAKDTLQKRTSANGGAVAYYDGNDINAVDHEFDVADAMLRNTGMSANQVINYLVNQRHVDQSPFFNELMAKHGYSLPDYVPEADDDAQSTYGLQGGTNNNDTNSNNNDTKSSVRDAESDRKPLFGEGWYKDTGVFKSWENAKKKANERSWAK